MNFEPQNEINSELKTHFENENKNDVFGYITNVNWDEYLPEIPNDCLLWNDGTSSSIDYNY